MLHWLQKFIAFFLIIILSPLFLLVGLLILFFGGGLPIFFTQLRVGERDDQFWLYKFRTMYPGAEEDQEKYMEMNEANGPVFKIKNDPRFTSVGKFLSHTGLDELPQLINVLKGQMNIVGPRPLPSKEVERLDKEYCKRHQVKPGIISPWLFNGYHLMTFEKWMKLDLKYVENQSFRRDLTLIARTIILVIRLIIVEFLDLILDKEN
jgi:lipopolysaccharide/colanic/teichoic acid biosynthesis glycosyltransferase